jgi:apolipoprotein N-acyltransferase
MPAWLGWIAVLLLSLYLAIYPALASAAAWWIARPKPPSCESRDLALVLAFAGAWTVSEWLRATLFTGFAWNPIGVVWVTLTPIARIGRFVGTYGLSGVAMLAAGGIAMAILTARRARRDGRTGKVVLLIGIPAAVMIALAPASCSIAFRACPRRRRAAAARRPAQYRAGREVGRRSCGEQFHQAGGAERQARAAPPSGDLARGGGPVLPRGECRRAHGDRQPARPARHHPHRCRRRSIWPRRYDRVRRQQPVRARSQRPISSGRYDKAHLVPFGEYLPMRPILSRIGLSRLAPGDADFNSGPGPRSVELPGIGKVGVQICYEIIFSGHVIDRADRPLLPV